ncbi:Flagellar hook-basal body complex protein FliE [Buchnera aphidicola (Eriosoma lanigerum)]|uniref:flagellar hook-basal body complex protein FliE n=1 Tax=Buchnera aphidicola TaxID=9 RepID=UPI003463E90E
MLIEGLKTGTELTQTNLNNSINKNNTSLTSVDIPYKFKSEFEKMVELQDKSQNNAEDVVLGEREGSLHKLMLDIDKSSLTIQLAVKMRNKLVAAYQDIMNMQA